MRQWWLAATVLAQVSAGMPCSAQADGDQSAASFIVTFATSFGSDDRAGTTGSLTMRVRGSLARIDMPQGLMGNAKGLYCLFDAARGRMTIVVPGRRLFAVVDSGKPDGAAARLLERTPRFSDVTGHRDSLGAGETILGFASRKYRMGMGVTMQTMPVAAQTEAMMQVRTETETEMNVSDEISALAPGFAAFGTAVSAGVAGNAAWFANDTAVRRVSALLIPARGFPILQTTTTRLSLLGATSTSVVSMRMTSFEREPVRLEDLRVPDGYTATDLTSLSRLRVDAAGQPPE